MAQAHLPALNGSARGLEGLLADGGLHGAAVYVLKQRLQVRADQVDDVLLERLLFGRRDAFAYRVLGPVGVPPPLLGKGAYVGHGVVGDLLGHGLVHLLTASGHGVGRADVGLRGHGRHVRGYRDERAGRRGARPAR